MPVKAVVRCLTLCTLQYILGAMNRQLELPTLKCLRCGHTWYPKKPVEPKVCPKCKSPYWNKPKWKGVNK